jgi:hypothetical protein
MSDRESEYMQKFVTDDQLRAECVRRKMEMDPWLDAATSDELRAECERRGMGDAARDRDEWVEWKRRAEVAEGLLAAVPKDAFSPRGVVAWLPDPKLGFMQCGHGLAGACRLCTPPKMLGESGPGIAAQRPDNSIAFLDEDLLCEDA